MSDKLDKERLDRLFSSNIDMNGRRVVNAGRSRDRDDYVTKEELDQVWNAIEKIKKLLGVNSL